MRAQDRVDYVALSSGDRRTVSLLDIIKLYLPLPFITFGGPQAHIAIMLDLFVVRHRWFSESVFTEILAISNALPGPASTQIAFSIALLKGGPLAGILCFLIWSVPGAIAMAGIAFAIDHLGANGMPDGAVSIENGLGAVAVALVALAAYRLGSKILTDRVETCLAVLSASFLINFTSVPWLIPTMMAAGGAVTFAAKKRKDWAGSGAAEVAAHDSKVTEAVLLTTYSARTGAMLTALAVVLLAITIPLQTAQVPLLVQIGATFYTVGCIVFGGGPVVIPMLYQSVVVRGWMSDAEFLFGLAIINSMPGPNFNFAAYCGTLAARQSNMVVGSMVAWCGIFLPGLMIKAGVLSMWQNTRRLPQVQTVFKGFNAVAVGMVFGAVYILWQKAIIVAGTSTATALGGYPFFVALSAIAFVSVDSLHIPVIIVVALGAFVGWTHSKL